MKFKAMLKHSLTFLTLVFFISCSSKVEDINDRTDNATYEFGIINKVASESISTNKARPDIKDTFTVDLMTCFKDKTYIQDIVAEEFAIKSSITTVKKRTNSSGCLSWREEFTFNYLMDETFFKLEGVITGKSNYKGITEYSLAVNPWTGEVVDLKFGSVSQIKEITQSNTKILGYDQKIELDHAVINVVEKQFYTNKTILKLEFSTEPKILRRTIDGAIVKERLTAGEFETEFYLLSKNLNNDERKILTTFSNDEYIRRDGQLKSLITFELSEGVDPNSIIELGIQVKDISGDTSFGSDFGIVNIDSIEGQISSKILNINMPFSSFEMSRKDYDEISPESFGFIVDKISVKNGSEGGANNTTYGGVNRSVDAKFTIKIVDSLVRKQIKNYPFKVELIDHKTEELIKSVVPRSLSNNGDLEFRASFKYKFYDKNYRPVLVRVTSTKEPFNNIVRERLIYCNPSIKNADFCIDSKFGEPPADTDEITPEIKLKGFNYHFVDNKKGSFKLNRNLDLYYEKVLRLEMDPKMKVSHDYEGGSGLSPILNGEYKVRMLILAPKDTLNVDYTREVDLEKYYTLTASEKNVVVEDGYINALLEFPLMFTDQIYYSLKNIVVIELSPVDVDMEIKPGYFVGTINGSKKADSIIPKMESGKRLSTGNINVAKSLIKRIKETKNKLQTDETIGDYFKDFTEQVRNVEGSVPVFDAKNLKIVQKGFVTQTFDTEEKFIKANNLKVSVDSLKEFIVSGNYIDDNVLKAICDVLYDKTETYHQVLTTVSNYGGAYSDFLPTKGERYKNCLKRPTDYIAIKKLNHVVSIEDQPKNVQVEPIELTKSVAYYMSRGQMFSNMKGIRETDYTMLQTQAGFDLGFEGSKFGLFGAASFGVHAASGSRTDLYTVKQDSDLLSKQKRNINQVGVSFDGDRFDVDFTAKVKSCVMIGGKMFKNVLPDRRIETSMIVNWLKDEKKPVLQSTNKRIYLCAQEHQRLRKIESYFFVKLAKMSTMADEALSRNTSVNVIRGVNNFEMYRRGQIEEDEALVLVEVEGDEVTKRYKKYLDNKGKNLEYKDRVGVGYPGLIE